MLNHIRLLPSTEDTECTVLAEGHHAYAENAQNAVKLKLRLHGMIAFSLVLFISGLLQVVRILVVIYLSGENKTPQQ
jgi:hypothetical protein